MISLNPPWWLKGIWMATGLSLGCVVGAAGAWAGRAVGPLVGGTAIAVLALGFLYWAAARPGRALGAVLQAAVSGGAMAALVIGWLYPLLATYAQPGWLPLAGLRLAVAGSAGVTLGLALRRWAGAPAWPFPEAAALARAIVGPEAGGQWVAPLGLLALAALIRSGVAAGWWPGAVLAGGGRGLWGLAGWSLAPGLLGLGLLLGRDRALAVGAGSLAMAAVILPAVLALGPAGGAPALRVGSMVPGLELATAFGPLVACGAAAAAAVIALVRATPRLRRPASWLPNARKPLAAGGAALLLAAVSLWRVVPYGDPAATLVVLLVAAGLLAAVALTGVSHLGTLGLPLLGLPALAVTAPALLSTAVGSTWPLPIPSALLYAGGFALTAALFAGDYLQTERIGLLVGTRLPLYPLKLVSCLAGLGGAWLASTALAANPGLAGPLAPTAGAALVSRTALAGAAGTLPLPLAVAGGGLGVLTALAGRAVWPLAVGMLLPFPAAVTLALGGLLAGRRPELSRPAGFGLLLGDLSAHGAAMLLIAWNVLPVGAGRWDELASPARGPAGVLAAGAVTVVLILAAGLADRRGGGFLRSPSPELPAGSWQETITLPPNYAKRSQRAR